MQPTWTFRSRFGHQGSAGNSPAIPNLDPGGGNFGPDGRYYVGSRLAGTIVSFDPDLNDAGQTFLPERVVPYPRGLPFRRMVPCTLRPALAQTGWAKTRSF